MNIDESAPAPPGPARQQPRFVEAGLGYAVATPYPAVTYMYEPAGGVPRENYPCDERRVPIHDARPVETELTVHSQGFELRDAPSRLRAFTDSDAVRRVYYAECAELACAVTGGTKAFVFDHLVRKREHGRPPLTFGRSGDGKNPAAVGRVHNDYSEASGRRRLGVVLREANEEARDVARYSIVNIWRSVAGPVLDTPLAVCDARSVHAADAIVNTIRYQERDGEIYLFRFAHRHRWFFFPEMDTHEALVFKQFDSARGGVARFTPHAAFDLPDVPPQAPLRESIEVRCLVIYQ